MPPELKQQMLAQAPPEIAEMLQNMSPDMLEALLGFAMDDDADFPDFFDEDDDDDYF